MTRNNDARVGEQRRSRARILQLEREPELALGTREVDPLQRGAMAEGSQAFEPPREDELDNSAIEVAQIVHDLKNPLGTMMLELHLLDDALAATGNEVLRRSVARLAHNVAFADRIVQDLLDSCAIGAGTLVLNRKPTELRAFLEQVIERTVPSRDRARVFLEASGSLTIDIDDLRIERVVANLLANALKYAPACSGIVVRLDVLADRVRISVLDSGKGITPTEMRYIFEKYRRTPSALAHEGSGLGLYVSRRIIEAHGGTIDVECVHGVGTRFYFDLPIC